MQKVSRITKGVIKHHLIDEARSVFSPMCLDAEDGLVLLLLGPPQSGKTILFGEIVSALRSSFRDERPGAIPIIDLQIETVSEGRAKPKWLGIQLLKALHHPIYQHIGCLDERDHYFPSKGRDEETVRIALKEGFSGRYARRVCLDEIHLLTRTKDPELRASILESIKSSCAIDRTLIGCGGYELAYRGLFDSAHFCGRVITYDFGNYDWRRKADVVAWSRILKTYSAHLELQPASLLIDEIELLMKVTNGVVGLLDKMLWQASYLARAKPITKQVLLLSAPPAKEQDAVYRDICLGQEALGSSLSRADRVKKADAARALMEKRGARRDAKPPFERSPNRQAAMDIALHDND